VRIRVCERIWEQASDPERLVSQVRDYLNRHVQYMWYQRARYRDATGEWRLGVERPVMLSLEKDALLKLILRPTGAGADYLLVALRKAQQEEVYEAATGKCLKDERFQVLRPWEETRDVAVVIHSSTYLKLPSYLRTPIVLAWDRFVEGLRQQKVPLDGGDTLFLLTGIPDLKRMVALDEALADARAGRVTTDPYETKRAADLCGKYGKKCGEYARNLALTGSSTSPLPSPSIPCSR